MNNEIIERLKEILQRGLNTSKDEDLIEEIIVEWKNFTKILLKINNIKNI